ncbi:hypothetical protein ACVI1N_000301 [Sinorhizobium medicae]
MASASGVSHKVKLPRRRNPASYSGQFVTLNFILPMRCGGRHYVCKASRSQIGY